MQRFELGPPLNSGSFATVYRALYKPQNIPVAVKKLPKNRGDVVMSRYKQLVQTEIDVMTTLKGHKNIVSLIDVIEDDEATYLIEEYCSGGQLNPAHPNPPQSHYQTVTDIVNALAHVHQNDIIYADLKPANIIFSRRHRCYKLTDFGSAIRVNPISKEGVISATTPSITPPRDFSPTCPIVTFKFDVYGLGLIANSLFQHETQLIPDIQFFISNCLDHNPETRFSTEEMQLYWSKIKCV